MKAKKKKTKQKKKLKKKKDKTTSLSLHTTRFPNESPGYRTARNRLLREEMKLRRHIEEISTLRRKLICGGTLQEDYLFEEGPPNIEDTQTLLHTRFSELFQHQDKSLIIYSFMYGADMDKPCPMCTSMLDGLNGNAIHIAQRANLAIVAKSPIQRIRAFVRERGWRHLRLLSSAGNTYNRDYRGETAGGSQIQSLNVFVQRNGKIHHFYNSELMFVATETGQDPRHLDLLWPLWNFLDLTPEGRGDWYPSLNYEAPIR